MVLHGSFANIHHHQHVLLSSLSTFTNEQPLWGQSWSFAALLGLAYGLLHIVGPDHLGTLISLSAAAVPRKAFFVGAAWSLGHCAGMVLVAGVVVVLQKAAHVDIEAWEHVGDYLIGISMVLCGLYFVVCEDKYLQEDANGTLSLKSCDCHGHATGHYGAASVHEHAKPAAASSLGCPTRLSGRQRKGRSKLRACSTYAAGCTPSANDSSCSSDCCAGSTGESAGELSDEKTDHLLPPPPPPPLPTGQEALPDAKADMEAGKDSDKSKEGKEGAAVVGANISSAMLGVLQGLCCPMGMVGIAFLTTLPASGVALFLITFLLVSAVGTGLLACGWAFLMRTQALSALSTKVLYRASCVFTFTLGAIWIVANYAGVLDKLNYAEHGHESVHMVLGASGSNGP